MASPDDVAGLDREYEELLTSDAIAERLVDIFSYELFDPARQLFGDRAVPFIVSTLRSTANMLERLGPLEPR